MRDLDAVRNHQSFNSIASDEVEKKVAAEREEMVMRQQSKHN